MGTPSRERRLIGGVWQYVTVSENGAGGGITEVTSDDNTVTVTDPTGPSVDLSAAGGSLPAVIAVTFTAAQISAAFSETDGAAYIEIPEITDDLLIAWVGEVVAPTLDGDAATYSPSFYTPGAASTDVYNNGDAYDGPFFVIGDWSDATYKRKVTPSPAAGFLTVDPAAAFYAGWSLSVVPTTGESYLHIGVWRLP